MSEEPDRNLHFEPPPIPKVSMPEPFEFASEVVKDRDRFREALLIAYGFARALDSRDLSDILANVLWPPPEVKG